MGWLLKIYLLENISMITILRIFRIGITYPDNNSKGIFIGIWKFNMHIILGTLDIMEFEEAGHA